MISNDVTIVIAFLAGILTFFTPCVLPLIPLYISYITGFSINELTQKNNKQLMLHTLISSIFFVMGFSFVFIAFGISVSFIGKLFLSFENVLRIIGGLIIIFFGLIVTGLFKVRFLEIEKRLTIKNKPLGYVGAFLVGAGFSVGWVPCVGPIISSILIVAGTRHSALYGFWLLSFYSLGLGMPIILTAVAFDYFLTFFKNIKKYMDIISILSGLLLIILGFLVITDSLTYLIGLLSWLINYKGI